jgi:NAD(P)-dependent dehydrogenase (short-subunit alcohol dehydrogenase family)
MAGYDLTGRIVIVTGSSRGIGRDTARLIARRGASVVANGRDPQALAETMGALEQIGGRHHGVIADIGDPAGPRKLVRATLERFGRVDVLVNNAGGEERAMGAEEVDEASWDRIVAVNLKGPFLCAQAVIEPMKKQRKGTIVNVSSQGGRAYSQFGNAAYAAAKAGLIGLTRQLAWELGPHGINVNTVAPGHVLSSEWRLKRWQNATDAERQEYVKKVPIGRPGEIEEIAAVIAFLASDEASYITGATLDVNGGRFMF